MLAAEHFELTGRAKSVSDYHGTRSQVKWNGFGPTAPAAACRQTGDTRDIDFGDATDCTEIRSEPIDDRAARA
jgi:hypothetical protein